MSIKPDRRKSIDVNVESLNLRKASANLRKAALNLQKASTVLIEEALIVSEETAVSYEELASTRRSSINNHQYMIDRTNSLIFNTLTESQKLADTVYKTKEEIYHLAYHDILTDLPNRTLLKDRLNQALDLASRHNNLLAVMFIDLNKFKWVNDNLGHEVGDELLKLVALSLVECVRSSDTVCRWGGDEFVILLPHVEHIKDLIFCAQKILDKLIIPFKLDNIEVSISASIGICLQQESITDADRLIKNADIAMYHAKKAANNSYKFFKPYMSY